MIVKNNLQALHILHCILYLSGLRLSFDFLPQVHLWFRPRHYHYSNKPSVKCTCITLYTYTVHCTIRTRAQSVRRQHRKRTSEKNEMVIYNDSTQVDRNMWVSFSWIKPLDRTGHNMLKWLVIYLLNKLALC